MLATRTSDWQSFQTLESLLYEEIADSVEASVEQGAEEPTGLLEWAQEYRRIKDRESKKVASFSLSSYPWLAAIYKTLSDLIASDRKGWKVVLRKAAQIGATELAINLTFYALDGRGNVFYALPPGPTTGDFAHARIDPAISASPHVSEMAGHVDNVGLKTFRGGFNLYIRGTHVPKGDPSRAPQLSEAPADVAVMDEFDRIPPAARGLVRDRLGDSQMAWELDLSTPTYPDMGIDREYQDTTRHELKVRCGCGAEAWLDWKLVRGPVAEDPRARIVCPSCGGVFEREGMWEEGRVFWEARDPGADVVGFWISKLASPRADLDAMWEESRSHREQDLQTFWNGTLGLPYEPKGARLTRELIAACVEPRYKRFRERARWTAMGVDVGLDLHCWVKERMRDGRERTVAVGSVPEWEDLDALMDRYGVRRCVVDDRPALRDDVAFRDRWRGKVWLGLEVDSPDAPMLRWKKKTGQVLIERTKAMAEAAQRVERGVDVLPRNWESEPEIEEHLTASIRAKRVRADGSTVYHYPQSSKPDHLHHAKLFCEAALSILPEDPGRKRGPKEEAPSFDGKSGYFVPGGSLRGQL
jgi:hypothetical protein